MILAQYSNPCDLFLNLPHFTSSSISLLFQLLKTWLFYASEGNMPQSMIKIRYGFAIPYEIL